MSKDIPETISISIVSRSNKGQSYYHYFGYPYASEMRDAKKHMDKHKRWHKHDKVTPESPAPSSQAREKQ